MFKKIIESMTGQIFTNLDNNKASEIISKYFNNNTNNFVENNKEKIN